MCKESFTAAFTMDDELDKVSMYIRHNCRLTLENYSTQSIKICYACSTNYMSNIKLYKICDLF